ncbi:hypothetical protein KTD28_06325 [Burkholderia gladioli]|uniref:hypothetical protein n=1 Tax=Burkholderia gladioli TaxID=28095 RepID=UPI00163E74FF|nr:hypothetical protein [Burkholderia gladioli]MBU9154224.1 hypothetical protein [Burkholderia gladioli]
MDPVWEYRWLYVDHFYGPRDTCFWMTDFEAEKWHSFGKEGTMRLEETKRDRNLQSTSFEHPTTTLGKGGGPERQQPLPEFESPTLKALRSWWVSPREAGDAGVRRLVLEVIMLRRQLRDAGLREHNESGWGTLSIREGVGRPVKQRVRRARRG